MSNACIRKILGELGRMLIFRVWGVRIYKNVKG